MNQRGFFLSGPMLYLVLALAVLASLAGLYLKVRHDGYTAGAGDVQARWDGQVRKDLELAAAARADRVATARRHSEQLHLAQASAAEYEQRWEEERAKGRRNKTPLGTCSAVASSSSSTPAGAQDPAGGVDLRLTWHFVSLYDSRWTRPDGQPVHGDPGGVLDRAGRPGPAASSPYGLDELLDTHEANAAACSAQRRQLVSLIRLIKDLRARWDAGVAR